MLTFFFLHLLLAQCLGFWGRPNQNENDDVSVLSDDIDGVKHSLDSLREYIENNLKPQKHNSTDDDLNSLKVDIKNMLVQAITTLTTTIKEGFENNSPSFNYTSVMHENEYLKRKLADAEKTADEDKVNWEKKIKEAAKSCTCKETSQTTTAASVASVSRVLKCGYAPVHLGASMVSRQSRPNGDVINYECLPGFIYMGGSKSAWCHPNGTMEFPTMHCKKPKCSVIPRPVGAKLQRIYRSPDGDIRSQYVCEKGLNYYSGTRTVQCKQNGEWKIPTILCASKDCFYYNGKKAIYDGPVNTTKSGRVCQKWNSNTPHNHRKKNNSPKAFDTDSSMKEVGNKCRDPERDPFPWCYTMDPKKRWEYCDIKMCEF